MECIICNDIGRPGLTFDGLHGEPFFCQRCLFLILMRDKPGELANYCKDIEPKDGTRSALSPENIWKEDV